MKREDYVKKATARIFDDRQKRAVSAELEDHIAHRTAALELSLIHISEPTRP